MSEQEQAAGLAEREAIRAAMQAIIDDDGWDADVAEAMYVQAVEGMAWGLLDATMDTSDREPSQQAYFDARNTARRLMAYMTTTAAPDQAASDGGKS